MLITLLLVPSCLFGWQEGSKSPDQARNVANANRELTLKVRRGIARDQSLSKAGHSVRIVANGAMVTLKGQVESEAEKKKIVEIAKQSAGNGNVLDQLTVEGESR